MSASSEPTAETSPKDELINLALKGGALAAGVADAAAFTAAPESHRPVDLLPDAKSVFVVGGASPRAGDWQSPNYQHMEITSINDRITALSLKLAHHVERKFGYYCVGFPPGVDRGQQPFVSIALAAELAGCGTASLAGPVLNAEYGFMYYAAFATTLPMEPDGPLKESACPAPECVEMWNAEGTTPCLSICPIDKGGCLGGRLEDGKIAEKSYDRARCTARVYNYWVPGFQKALDSILTESDKESRRMMIHSTFFTRTLWSITYANVSQGQCYECMRVCPVGKEHRTLK
ncbi:MAG: hypothetical protein WD076_02600 [Parvularculaceae bacterium]